MNQKTSRISGSREGHFSLLTSGHLAAAPPSGGGRGRRPALYACRRGQIHGRTGGVGGGTDVYPHGRRGSGGEPPRGLNEGRTCLGPLHSFPSEGVVGLPLAKLRFIGRIKAGHELVLLCTLCFAERVPSCPMWPPETGQTRNWAADWLNHVD